MASTASEVARPLSLALPLRLFSLVPARPAILGLLILDTRVVAILFIDRFSDRTRSWPSIHLRIVNRFFFCDTGCRKPSEPLFVWTSINELDYRSWWLDTDVSGSAAWSEADWGNNDFYKFLSTKILFWVPSLNPRRIVLYLIKSWVGTSVGKSSTSSLVEI